MRSIRAAWRRRRSSRWCRRAGARSASNTATPAPAADGRRRLAGSAHAGAAPAEALVSARAVPVHRLYQRGDVLRAHVRGHAVAEVEHVALARTAIAFGIAVEHARGLAGDRLGAAVQGGRVEVALQRDLA